MQILNWQRTDGLEDIVVARLQGFRPVPFNRGWKNPERGRGRHVFPGTNGILGRIVRKHNTVPDLCPKSIRRRFQQRFHQQIFHTNIFLFDINFTCDLFINEIQLVHVYTMNITI